MAESLVLKHQLLISGRARRRAPNLNLISRIKGTPAVEIGWVDAPDAATAIKEAIKRYGITDREQQKRLAARQVK